MQTEQNTWQEIRHLILPLYLPAFIFSFSQSLLIPVVPLFAQSFGIPLNIIGLILAGEAIGMLIGDLPSGLLLRRFGQKGSMLAGVTLTGIATVALFFAQTIWIVLVCRVISGLGVAMFSIPRQFFLTEMVPVARRGRLISIFGGLFRLGRLLGPLVGGFMGAAFGLRSSFFLFGGMCLITLVIVLFFLPQIEVVHSEEGGQNRSIHGYLVDMFKIHYQILIKAGSGAFFLYIIRSGPAALVPLYASLYLGLDVAAIGLVMSLSSALDMMLFYPAGILMDRKGRKYAIISSCLIMSIGMGLIPYTYDFFSLLGAGMIAGLGNGLGSGAMLTLGSDLAPKKGRGEFLGAWNLIADLGGTSSPLMVGGLAESITLPGTAWVVAAAGAAAGLIFLLWVPETLVKKSK